MLYVSSRHPVTAEQDQQDQNAIHVHDRGGFYDRDERIEIQKIEKAMKAKDKALLWIFIVERAVVSATSMVAGSILWTLLVRRRLYKEVGQTRLVVDL